MRAWEGEGSRKKGVDGRDNPAISSNKVFIAL
jgi:hypothetical protein